MTDRCLLSAASALEMKNSGLSLARTLYHAGGTIVLQGELGAGKTTFVQGFAEGLGLQDRIPSPTYALEQRYGDVLSHIDLFRLTSEQAADFLQGLDPFPGWRVIEWSDRGGVIDAGIEIGIEEKKGSREIDIEFSDIAVPTNKEIEEWIHDVALPPHITKHMRQVTAVALTIADHLTKSGRVIRRRALEAGALLHDLLRFVDFKTFTGDEYYTPKPRETETWTEIKKRYGTPHEKAVEKFLIDKGYPEVGRILRTHRGYADDPSMIPETIEQYVLAYADKRSLYDKTVTVDERFDDFMRRYGKGDESEHAKIWRTEVKKIEAMIFPDGAPF